MRMSHALFKTQKHITTGAELPSHQLLLRAGLARRLAVGIYSLTPLAYRVIRRIEAILREEIERIGGQEVLLPIAQPAELWRESGRDETIDAALARWRDRGGHAMVLAMTHEEAVTDLARSVITSYRQLPQLVFQIQSKFRDEARPRGGLVRLREFLMQDAYSFHTDQADLDAFYERVVEAYHAIFARLELPVLVVQADTGMMGGIDAHEFMLLADGGEDTLIVCPRCAYAANQEIALADTTTGREATGREATGREVTGGRAREETPREIATPGATTIAALCEAAACTPEETLKSVFYAAGDELVLALIRGDLEVSAVKLGHLVGREVRALAATEAEGYGLVIGYAGPVGLRVTRPARVVADDSVVSAGGLVAGANRVGYHLAGVMYGRHYTAERVGDLAVAAPGHRCVRCGAALEARRGIEAANTFKLGTKYSATMGATFRDAEGTTRALAMGCYGIGITRLLACVLERHHDADGILWPVSLAPYAYHLLAAGNDEAARAAAEALYVALGAEATLYDDRDVSAGVAFKDADLLGMPLRIMVSARSLAAGGAEVRTRRTGEARIVPLADVPTVAASLVAERE
ncbi:MAG: proline--tRNA ligase [Ktedonobacterales bacterium]|nr:proline--tRNA ligase [Ktedonobacterales bacterium]